MSDILCQLRQHRLTQIFVECYINFETNGLYFIYTVASYKSKYLMPQTGYEKLLQTPWKLQIKRLRLMIPVAKTQVFFSLA